MSVKDFECEFVSDLESFVQNPIQIVPLEKWDPRDIAAPERHFMLGKGAHKSLDSQIYMLRDNCAFQDIESILHMSFNSAEYSESEDVHPIKEQVWLFGYRWLEHYLKFLAIPGSMRKEFYRRHNDRFLEIIGCFLTYNPDERISFYDALRMWDPQHTLLSEPPGRKVRVDPSFVAGAVSTVVAETPNVLRAEISASAGALDHSIQVPPSESEAAHLADALRPVASAPAAAVAAAAVVGRRRLNLIRQIDSVGRTKTRKACNSTRSPATDNHD